MTALMASQPDYQRIVQYKADLEFSEQWLMVKPTTRRISERAKM
jgi:hypothetical protein